MLGTGRLADLLGGGIADQRRHQLVGAHPDGAMDLPRRHPVAVRREGGPPRDDVQVVGVDQRAVDVQHDAVVRRHSGTARRERKLSGSGASHRDPPRSTPGLRGGRHLTAERLADGGQLVERRLSPASGSPAGAWRRPSRPSRRPSRQAGVGGDLVVLGARAGAGQEHVQHVRRRRSSPSTNSSCSFFMPLDAGALLGLRLSPIALNAASTFATWPFVSAR